MRSVSFLWGSAVNPCLSENSSGRGCRILVYRGWLLPFDRQMPPARPVTRPQIRSHLSRLSLLGALGLHSGPAMNPDHRERFQDRLFLRSSLGLISVEELHRQVCVPASSVPEDTRAGHQACPAIWFSS